MHDVEKNRTANEIAGIDVVKAMSKRFHNEPIRFHAVYHQWQLDTADAMLSLCVPVKDIVRITGLDRSTIHRRKNLLLKGNSRKS